MSADRKELLRKARLIEIKSRKLVSQAMAGEYQSVFRGTGVEFESVREYVFGDEVRSIDWNVTARTGKPFVKRFVESRERSVLLVLDRSPSLEFGSAGRTKADVAAELCAVLALAAARNRDQVGLLLFTDRVESFLPPGRGAEWPHRIVQQLLTHEALGRGTDYEPALEHLERSLRRRAVVFLISDFLQAVPERTLTRLRRRHDVVAVHVGDPREQELVGTGIFDCRDPEGGVEFQLDAGSASERRQFRKAAEVHRLKRRDALRRARVEELALRTDSDLLPPLLRFFENRERAER